MYALAATHPDRAGLPDGRDKWNRNRRLLAKKTLWAGRMQGDNKPPMPPSFCATCHADSGPGGAGPNVYESEPCVYYVRCSCGASGPECATRDGAVRAWCLEQWGRYRGLDVEDLDGARGEK